MTRKKVEANSIPFEKKYQSPMKKMKPVITRMHFYYVGTYIFHHVTLNPIPYVLFQPDGFFF